MRGRALRESSAGAAAHKPALGRTRETTKIGSTATGSLTCHMSLLEEEERYVPARTTPQPLERVSDAPGSPERARSRAGRANGQKKSFATPEETEGNVERPFCRRPRRKLAFPSHPPRWRRLLRSPCSIPVLAPRGTEHRRAGETRRGTGSERSDGSSGTGCIDVPLGIQSLVQGWFSPCAPPCSAGFRSNHVTRIMSWKLGIECWRG